MQDRIHQFLGELGLSESECEAYQTALGLGTFAASTLGLRLRIPRSTARYACESLVGKGLMVETRKGNTKLFVAENPTKLFSILFGQEEELRRRRERLEATVRELEKRYDPDAKIPKITFYEGEDGISRMFDELVKTPATLRSFWAGDYMMQTNPEMIRSFREKGRKAYGKVFIMRSPKYEPLHHADSKNYRTKYFRDIEDLRVDFQITDDMVSIASTSGTIPIGVLIKHREITQAFGQIFEELWNRTEG